MTCMREYIATIKRILDVYAVFPIQKCDEEEVDLKAGNVSLLEFIGASKRTLRRFSGVLPNIMILKEKALELLMIMTLICIRR